METYFAAPAANFSPSLRILEKEIDHDGVAFRGGMAAFARGGAGNHGGAGIDGEELADPGDFHHAAVGDDVRDRRRNGRHAGERRSR